MNTVAERPEYLRRIDEALLKRGKIVSAIEAYLAESRSNHVSSALSELLTSLRGNPTAEQFVQDRSTAVWLPLLLRAGEGVNGTEFRGILGDLSLTTEVRRSSWLRYLYPIAVGAIAFALMLLISITILPTFQTMFREFALKLPASTRMVLTIGAFVREQPVLFLFCLILAFVGTRLAVKAFFLALSHLENSIFIGPWLVGNSHNLRSMGRFLSTLAELLHIGAPLSEAIEIAGRSSQSVRFQKSSRMLAKEIGTDRSKPQGSLVAHQFPSLMFQALEAGPNKGPSIPLLRQVAVTYVERAEARVQLSSGVISPLAIIVIGGCVWFVIVSLLMPLLSLITSLSGAGS